MKYDGREYRPNKHLGFRKAREGDTYADGAVTTDEGDQIPVERLVFFRWKDCPTGTHMGQSVVYPAEVPSDKLVPICAHLEPTLAVSSPTFKKGGTGGKTRYNIGEEHGEVIAAGDTYVEQAHYLVYDEAVYQWTSRRKVNIEDAST